MKFEIYSKDKNVYKILHELMFENRKIKNKSICAMYEWSDFKADYKEKNKIYPKPDKILKNKKGGFYKSDRGYIDYIVRDKYYKNNSSNTSSSVQNAIKLFKSRYLDMLKGLYTLPYYKQSNNIILHNININIYKEQTQYFVDLSLLSNKYKKELDIKSGQFIFNMIVKDNSQRTIINHILSNQYSIVESQIRYIKRLKKFFIYLGYSFNQTKFTVKKNILGIDLGIKYAAYIALKDSFKRWKIPGNEIEVFRKQIEKRRYFIRQQRNTTTNRQRGRNNMLKPVTKISDKISRFRDTINHQYSKFIINIASKNDVGTIVMEDLSKITENNKFLRNWSYYDLQQKIKYKANEIGIKFILINPAYTSQTCSHCGYINKENRLTQEQFKCLSCEFEVNADYNAALNIANMG